MTDEERERRMEETEKSEKSPRFVEVNRNDRQEKGNKQRYRRTPPNRQSSRALSFNELQCDPEASDPEKEDVDDCIATAARE